MKTLVTGVAGFIGSTLAERLIRDGHEVVGIDCFSEYYDREIKKSNISSLLETENFEFIEADLNKADLQDLLQGVQVIYHQAGQPGVRKSWGSDFSSYVDANILATQRLLEGVCHSANDISRFVYASSSSVYGNAEKYPTTESDTPQPRSPYGVTKLAAEHLVSLYADNFGVPTVSLRYFTVYGPRQRPDMAFNRFISRTQNGQTLQIHGDGNQVREFTYVEDIVEANIRAGTAVLDPGVVINLSGGTSVSVNQVLELLETIHGEPLAVERGAPALGDVFRTGGSTERAKALLDWEPQISIDEGLSLEYEWFAKQASS